MPPVGEGNPGDTDPPARAVPAQKLTGRWPSVASQSGQNRCPGLSREGAMIQMPTDQGLAADLPPAVTLGGTALRLVGRARMYTCGITPYDVTHLGHAATYVWADTLARTLHACGAEVIVCRNVTDVDDVLLAAAGRAGEPYDRFAAIQQFYFDRDMAALGVAPPAIQPRAHAYVGQVIALAAGLLAQGAAYERG